MINNKLKITFACGLFFNSFFALAQSTSVPTNDERYMKSVTQLIAAMSIQRGIDNDPSCKGKKYKSISLDDYVELIANKDWKDGKKPKTKAEKDDMKKMITGLIDINEPGRGVVWKETYKLMVKNTNNASSISGEALCDSLNGNAVSLFQKAMDNLMLMK